MSGIVGAAFGARALRSTLPVALELERAEGRSGSFQRLDALLNRLVERMLAGDAIAEFGMERNRPHFALRGLEPEERIFIDEQYALSALEERGCFFAPEEVALEGVIQFAHYHRGWSRFGARATEEAQVKIQTKGSPQSMFSWAVLTPIAELLYSPIRVAGRFERGRALEKSVGGWPTTQAVLADLGLDVTGMGVTERTGRWHNQQLWRREQILARLQYRPKLGTGLRAALTRFLAERYYAKVDKKGQVTRRRMLNREYEQLLIAIFRGSWQDFVAYLGEQLHPDDITDKPAPTLLKAQRVELPSPAEVRLDVVRRHWLAVGQVERAQRATDLLPAGLVPEGDNYLYADGRTGQLVVLDGWRLRFPPDLNSDILRLWGSQYWPGQPQRVVTNPNPQLSLGGAAGPALRFWHGAFLTLWYMCRGGWSRTTHRDLGRYYERDLLELHDLGCSVDRESLDSIANAERLLGMPREVAGKRESIQSAGIQIEISTEITTERDGFERARDVISTARDGWALAHLEAYLERRVQQVLEPANRFYWRAIADRGKPPTLKQFASAASALTDDWLGGDVAAAYSAIGADTPIASEQVGRPALPRIEFVQKVLEGLSTGQRLEFDPMKDRYRESWDLVSMANAGLRYLRVMEGIGSKPQLKAVHGIVERYAEARAVEPQEILDWYAQVVEWALAQFPTQDPGALNR